MQALDFLAIGDLVMDDFIRLKDASVHCKLNNDDCEICMRWGDKIPFESSTLVPAVGNGPNAAVSAARLGLHTGLRAYVGDDARGQECFDALQKDGVVTDFVEKSAGKRTNYHYVLWYESQRTILVKHEEFDYTVPTLEQGPKWLYLTSLGDNSLPYHSAWVEWLSKHPETKLAFQPGTFQMKLGIEALKDVYARTEIFFCNKEEAERILEKPTGSDIKELLSSIRSLGPKIAVITDDIRGAYAMSEEGAWFIPRYPDPREPFERTGAGDALGSTTTAALAAGLSVQQALLWGPVNASAVVQEVGAQKGLLTREELEHNLKNPPSEYALKAI